MIRRKTIDVHKINILLPLSFVNIPPYLISHLNICISEFLSKLNQVYVVKRMIVKRN